MADLHPAQDADPENMDDMTTEDALEGEGDQYAMEMEEEYASSSQGSSSQTSTLTWINWFTSLPGHDYYCEVHEEFIEDDFNLTGLQAQVPFWKEALEMVLDVEPEEDSLTIPDVSIIESSAELLYGLVHQRFILTKPGLTAMAEKFEQSSFGGCPRVFCHGQPVIPCGRTDTPGLDTVKLFCPNCQDIYGPPSSKYSSVDGAFFGTSFPTLFFQTYPSFQPMPFKAGSTSTQGTQATPTSETSGMDTSPRTTAANIIASLESPGSRNLNVWRGAGGPLTSSHSEDGEESPRLNPNPHGGTKMPSTQIYVPRIYGFKVSERARSGPRMNWLRDRPEGYEELDKVDWRGRWIGIEEGVGAGAGAGVGGREGGESQ